MRYNAVFVFCIFALLSFSCKREKENKKEPIRIYNKNKTMGNIDQEGVNASGLYVPTDIYDRPSRVIINIWVYISKRRKGICLADSTINLLKKKKILPHFENYDKYGNPMGKFEDYDKYGNLIGKNIVIYKDKTYPKREPSAYYEIILDSYHKVTGKLYNIGHTYDISRSGVYMSDTTNKFGWFVIHFPSYGKLPYLSNSYNARKNTFITSLDPKAQIFCGEIKKVSYVYRNITPEEAEALDE